MGFNALVQCTSAFLSMAMKKVSVALDVFWVFILFLNLHTIFLLSPTLPRIRYI